VLSVSLVFLHARETRPPGPLIPHGLAGAVPPSPGTRPCLDRQTAFGTAASAQPAPQWRPADHHMHSNRHRRCRGQQPPQSLAAQNTPLQRDPRWPVRPWICHPYRCASARASRENYRSRRVTLSLAGHAVGPADSVRRACVRVRLCNVMLSKSRPREPAWNRPWRCSGPWPTPPAWRSSAAWPRARPGWST
jgi:hypothetical protein